MKLPSHQELSQLRKVLADTQKVQEREMKQKQLLAKNKEAARAILLALSQSQVAYVTEKSNVDFD